MRHPCAVLLLASLTTGCTTVPVANPEDATPQNVADRPNRVDEVAQDLAKVLAELEERKRKLMLLETLKMERDLKQQRLGIGSAEQDVYDALGAPNRAAVVETLGEKPMMILEYPGREFYIRSRKVVALKRYR